MTDFEERQEMVETQVRARGVRDERILAAFASVPRERFVPDINRASAYMDAPLPIGEGQTISQPYIVAHMIETLALKGGEKVLEIGSGSGYAAAILGKMVKEVFAIERIETLAVASVQTLQSLGIVNVQVRFGDGADGWPDEAPFDAILVSAGASKIPAALKSQLAVGGRMVIPLGRTLLAQTLVRVTRLSEDEFSLEDNVDVRFVPLIGGVAPASEPSERLPRKDRWFR